MPNLPIVSALRIHAAATARYAINGSYGTAVDRSDTYVAVARAMKPEDATNAHLLILFARFFLAAGAYAGGMSKENQRFEGDVEYIAAMLDRGNTTEFGDKVAKLVDDLIMLDPRMAYIKTFGED